MNSIIKSIIKNDIAQEKTYHESDPLKYKTRKNEIIVKIKIKIKINTLNLFAKSLTTSSSVPPKL